MRVHVAQIVVARNMRVQRFVITNCNGLPEFAVVGFDLCQHFRRNRRFVAKRRADVRAIHARNEADALSDGFVLRSHFAQRLDKLRDVGIVHRRRLVANGLKETAANYRHNRHARQGFDVLQKRGDELNRMLAFMCPLLGFQTRPDALLQRLHERFIGLADAERRGVIFGSRAKRIMHARMRDAQNHQNIERTRAMCFQ